LNIQISDFTGITRMLNERGKKKAIILFSQGDNDD